MLTIEDKEGRTLLNCIECPLKNNGCSVLRCRNMLMKKLHEYEFSSSFLEELKQVESDE